MDPWRGFRVATRSTFGSRAGLDPGVPGIRGASEGVIWSSDPAKRAMAGAKNGPNVPPCGPKGEAISILPEVYPESNSVFRTKASDPKQRLWFVFDHALVLPEYLVEYEYDLTPGLAGKSPGLLNTNNSHNNRVRSYMVRPYRVQPYRVRPYRVRPYRVCAATAAIASAACGARGGAGGMGLWGVVCTLAVTGTGGPAKKGSSIILYCTLGGVVCILARRRRTRTNENVPDGAVHPTPLRTVFTQY
eukprot:1179651-Prorocentrum_minimum.AAC.2